MKSGLLKIMMVAPLLLSSTANASDWVSDWFAQETSTPAGSYHGQQRGYYTGGGVDARYRLSNDYLVSLQPPSIKVGCGGIDIMNGSLSYLNMKYLVQKLEGILQAAPAFAFDLAMQEYCKPCVATLQYLDAVTDELNHIQMNDCQAAQGLAHAIVQPSAISQQMSGLSAETDSLQSGLEDTWNHFQQDVASSPTGASPTPQSDTTSACSSDFQKIFLGGSVIENSAKLIGLDGYADIMRGMLGDVVTSYNAGQQLYTFQELQPCPGNDQKSGDDFMNGNVSVEDKGGNCSAGGLTSISTVVNTNLNGIVADLLAGSAPSASEQAFIDQSPLPLYNVLKDSVQTDTTPQTLAMLGPALSTMYAHRVLDDLYSGLLNVLGKAKVLQTTQQSGTPTGGNANNCSIAFMAPEFQKLDSIKDATVKYRGLIGADYIKDETELLTNAQLAATFYQQHQKMLNEQNSPMYNGK